MRGVNNVILTGNATRAAEPRHIQAGKPVSNIRLATSGAALDVGEEKGDGAGGKIGHGASQDSRLDMNPTIVAWEYRYQANRAQT
jgi:hypothetical protein